MSEVPLSGSIRDNLVSLQNSTNLLGRTSTRLGSGLKVNNPLDNPTNYFIAANLNDRASQTAQRLDGMGQALNTIRVADTGVSAIRALSSQLRALGESALQSTDSNVRRELGEQFNQVMLQMNSIARDSSYNGINLLQGENSEAQTLTVQFAEDSGQSTLEVQGANIQGPTATVDAEGNVNSGFTVITDTQTVEISSFGTQGEAWQVDFGASDYRTSITNVLNNLDTLDDALASQSRSYSTSLSTISIREDFGRNLNNILETGAGDLTLADLNEEGANLLSLQTSQQLGTSSLAMASRNAQNVLRLLQ